MNKIFCGDARKMTEIEDNSVNLIVTSPPYNVDKEYDAHNDLMNYDEYYSFLNTVWQECYRVLTEDGRICINVANTHRKPYHHHSGIIAQQLVNLGYNLRGEIIWIKKDIPANFSSAWGSFNSPSNPSLRDLHEYIIIAHKGEAKLQRKGRTDLVRSKFPIYTLGEWYIRPVNSYNKLGHPAPFPLEIPKRCIQLYTYVGDTVLDPFSGSGTTCFAAKMLKRKYIGYDLSEQYCQIARDRCKQSFLPNWNFSKKK